MSRWYIFHEETGEWFLYEDYEYEEPLPYPTGYDEPPRRRRNPFVKLFAIVLVAYLAWTAATKANPQVASIVGYLAVLVQAQPQAALPSGGGQAGDPEVGGGRNVKGRAQVFSGKIAPFFPPSVKYWEGDILNWANQYDLDPNLIATVMTIESCGNPRARSSAGAMGLFQVMPFHFERGEDGFDPQTNARRGMSYLRQGLRKSGGRVELALAGYNGGHGKIGQAPNTWPNETRIYVSLGSKIYNDAVLGKQENALIRAYLNNPSSMCRRAERALGLK